MTKKQILATCLAGALTLGCVSGCANKKVEAQRTEIENMLINEDEIREGYIVSVTMASVRLTENGTVEYVTPGPNWVLLGNKCYQVSRRTTMQATICLKEDGTAEYYLPEGGILSGSVGYVDSVIEDSNLINKLIAEYVEKQEANKKTLK